MVWLTKVCVVLWGITIKNGKKMVERETFFLFINGTFLKFINSAFFSLILYLELWQQQPSVPHHLVLQGWSHQPLQSLTLIHPERSSGWRSGMRHAVLWDQLAEPGFRWLSIFRICVLFFSVDSSHSPIPSFFIRFCFLLDFYFSWCFKGDCVW